MTNVALDTLNFTTGNSFGLAPGNTTLTIPYRVSGGVTSNVHSGAINKLGELWMWADNNHGALGQNNRTDYSSPSQVPGTWNQVAQGWYHVMSLKTD